MPDETKQELERIAKYFDLSLSSIILRFCRDGIAKFASQDLRYSPPKINSEKKILSLQ